MWGKFRNKAFIFLLVGLVLVSGCVEQGQKTTPKYTLSLDVQGKSYSIPLNETNLVYQKTEGDWDIYTAKINRKFPIGSHVEIRDLEVKVPKQQPTSSDDPKVEIELSDISILPNNIKIVLDNEFNFDYPEGSENKITLFGKLLMVTEDGDVIMLTDEEGKKTSFNSVGDTDGDGNVEYSWTNIEYIDVSKKQELIDKIPLITVDIRLISIASNAALDSYLISLESLPPNACDKDDIIVLGSGVDSEDRDVIEKAATTTKTTNMGVPLNGTTYDDYSLSFDGEKVIVNENTGSMTVSMAEGESSNIGYFIFTFKNTKETTTNANADYVKFTVDGEKVYMKSNNFESVLFASRSSGSVYTNLIGAYANYYTIKGLVGAVFQTLSQKWVTLNFVQIPIFTNPSVSRTATSMGWEQPLDGDDYSAVGTASTTSSGAPIVTGIPEGKNPHFIINGNDLQVGENSKFVAVNVETGQSIGEALLSDPNSDCSTANKRCSATLDTALSSGRYFAYYSTDNIISTPALLLEVGSPSQSDVLVELRNEDDEISKARLESLENVYYSGNSMVLVANLDTSSISDFTNEEMNLVSIIDSSNGITSGINIEGSDGEYSIPGLDLSFISTTVSDGSLLTDFDGESNFSIKTDMVFDIDGEDWESDGFVVELSGDKELTISEGSLTTTEKTATVTVTETVKNPNAAPIVDASEADKLFDQRDWKNIIYTGSVEEAKEVAGSFARLCIGSAADTGIDTLFGASESVYMATIESRESINVVKTIIGAMNKGSAATGNLVSGLVTGFQVMVDTEDDEGDECDLIPLNGILSDIIIELDNFLSTSPDLASQSEDEIFRKFKSTNTLLNTQTENDPLLDIVTNNVKNNIKKWKSLNSLGGSETHATEFDIPDTWNFYLATSDDTDNDGAAKVEACLAALPGSGEEGGNLA